MNVMFFILGRYPKGKDLQTYVGARKKNSKRFNTGYSAFSVADLTHRDVRSPF
jgi:hypothetical protein